MLGKPFDVKVDAAHPWPKDSPSGRAYCDTKIHTVGSRLSGGFPEADSRTWKEFTFRTHNPGDLGNQVCPASLARIRRAVRRPGTVLATIMDFSQALKTSR